jgi:nicotinamide mononucleotide transporter
MRRGSGKKIPAGSWLRPQRVREEYRKNMIHIEPVVILGQQTSWLEIVAMVTGVAGVWLTARQNILCFPVGIVNVALYAWLFFSPGVRLYADALLQCVYVILLLYGWFRWAGKNGARFQPKSIGAKPAFRVFVLVFSGTLVLGFFLQKYTDASYPWLDSSLTCASLAAQWMIARKFIENWIVWIVADLIYIPLYVVKQLPLTAALYFLFLILAGLGYSEWKKKLTSYA